MEKDEIRLIFRFYLYLILFFCNYVKQKKKSSEFSSGIDFNGGVGLYCLS